MKTNFLLFAALHAIYVERIVCTDTCSEGDETCDNPPSSKGILCGLYLAKSSIPNAGLGIFSARDIPEGSQVGNPDILLPIYDQKDQGMTGSFSSHLWAGGPYGMGYESVNTEALGPGLVCSVNTHQERNTAFKRVDYDSNGLHRSKNPGVGAFTMYHNVRMEATRPIWAGMELFLEYSISIENDTVIGDNYYDEEMRQKYLDRAERVSSGFADIMNEQSSADSQHALEKAWALIRDEIVVEPLREYLPESMSKLVDHNPEEARLQSLSHSVEWLQANGQCMDNLYAAPSTIEEAGRGAYATRFLAKGTVIAPAPLQPVYNRDELIIVYKAVEDDKPEVLHRPLPKNQLFLNYCFGNNQSSLLLCPYGANVGLINHDGKAPNAKIMWSSNKNFQESYLNKTIEELKEAGLKTVLFFDVVATRDIQAGEEVFIDYGKEWEEAWEKHVRGWAPPDDSFDYVEPSIFNATNPIIRTKREQAIDPYPEHIQTACYFNVGDQHVVTDVREKENFYFVQWTESPDHYDPYHLLPCEVTVRRKVHGTYEYSAKMTDNGLRNSYELEDDDDGEFEEDREKTYYTVSNMPRGAIVFVGQLYTSDMHLGGAFRHEMMIPDDMFPSSWIDGYIESETCRDKFVECPDMEDQCDNEDDAELCPFTCQLCYKDD